MLGRSEDSPVLLSALMDVLFSSLLMFLILRFFVRKWEFSRERRKARKMRTTEKGRRRRLGGFFICKIHSHVPEVNNVDP